VPPILSLVIGKGFMLELETALVPSEVPLCSATLWEINSHSAEWYITISASCRALAKGAGDLGAALAEKTAVRMISAKSVIVLITTGYFLRG